jgi:hypothetical protein
MLFVYSKVKDLKLDSRGKKPSKASWNKKKKTSLEYKVDLFKILFYLARLKSYIIFKYIHCADSDIYEIDL